MAPSLLAYYLAYGSQLSFWPSWTVIAVLEIYFVFVVMIWGRARGRRHLAAGVAGVAVVLDRTLIPVTTYVTSGISSEWVFRASYASIVLFVVAWGVARRRHPRWMVGVIPAIGVVVLALWYYQSTGGQNLNWWTFWLVDIGAFITGCTLCWVIDKPATHGVISPIDHTVTERH